MVSRWRNGKITPTARNCDSIARAFGVERQYVLQLAGHVDTSSPPPLAEDEAWSAKQREWAERFERHIHTLRRREHDDCTERTVTAWLDGFNLMVERMRA
jgi:transcriptional regulator with XRE-family HTH domain